jgi:hypothetical protein
LVIPVLWIVISNVWMLVSRDQYQGELQVVPASIGMSGMSSAASRTGGIGGLLGGAGLGSLLSGADGDSMFSMYTESWTMPWFADELRKNQDLTRRIFSKQWSEENKSWKPRAFGIGALVRLVFGVTDHEPVEPNTDKMLGFLKRNVKIEHVRTEVVSMITIEGDNRDTIRDFLTFGNQKIMEHVRQIYQKRARDNIASILTELQKVSVSDYRLALINELAEQEKIRMMADTNGQLAAQSFGVYVTDAPIWPQGALIVAGSLALSFFGYIVIVLMVAKRGIAARSGASKKWGSLGVQARRSPNA